MKLLYLTAQWHSLAKLRMHTESSLTLLEALTSEFGWAMRGFQELTCSQYVTTELPREVAARKHRELNFSLNRSQVDTTNHCIPDPIQNAAEPTPRVSSNSTRPHNGQLQKTLNLSTIKFHSLGDYVQHIRLWGTTDSYSTQLVFSIFCRHKALLFICHDQYRASLLIVLSNVCMA